MDIYLGLVSIATALMGSIFGIIGLKSERKNLAKIGVKYFKNRKKIAREYEERLEKLTASKEPKTFREPKKKNR